MIGVKEIVNALKDPGDAHNDEEFAVEDELLLDVAVDPVRVVGIV